MNRRAPAVQALEVALARWGERPAAGERPGPALGAQLAKLRARAGLSNAQAMRALRRQLRRQVNRWTDAEMKPWEADASAVDPWLLVEYLEALEAPLESWLEVLELLMVEGPAGTRGGELRRRYATADAELRAEMLATVRAWVRAEAEMARLPCQLGAIDARLDQWLAPEPEAAPASAAAGTGSKPFQREDACTKTC